MKKKVMKAEPSMKTLDWVRWALALFIVVGGIVANSLLSGTVALPIRMIAWIGLVAVAGSILAFTAKGAMLLAYAKESRVELRKVVWPTRQEAVQTTLIILVIVFITAIIMWFMDSFLLWAIGWLTGQRG